MLREIWLGLKRFWGLRWIVKGPVLVGFLCVVIGVVVLFLFFVETVPTVGQADRANKEVLTSLAPYPGASLIGKYRFNDYRTVPDIFGSTDRVNYRTLTHVYAYPADTTAEEVLDFYRLELQKADWEPSPGELGGPDTLFREDCGCYLYLIPLSPDLWPAATAPAALLAALLEPATSIATPPRGSVTFFAISVAKLAR